MKRYILGTNIEEQTRIYPSSFTNVHFWKKIEFPKLITKLSYNKSEGLKTLQSLQQFHDGALVGYQGEKTLAFLYLEGK